MINFVTWPPNYYKGGQVTNLIIFVNICYKLLYVIRAPLMSDFLHLASRSVDIKVYGYTYLRIYKTPSYWPS